MNQNSCPVCGENAAITHPSDIVKIECNRCGSYRMASNAYEDKECDRLDRTHKALLSGKIIHGHFLNHLILREDIEQVAKMQPLNITVKAEEFLKFWAKRYPKAGTKFNFKTPDGRQAISSAYAEDDQELQFIILDMLADTMGLLSASGAGREHLKITPKGWEYLSHLGQINKDSNNVFCAMWFTSETQEYFNTVMNIIEVLGYSCIRIDLIEHSNKICDEIVRHIKSSKFIIADYTGHRGGVYYEAGIAHGRNIPAIFTCRDDHFDDLHFDIRQYNCIKWSQTDLSALGVQLQNRITAQIT